MKRCCGLDNLPRLCRPAVTVGSFDGVHGGHRQLLDRVVAEARAAGGESVVLTFEPHPRVTLGRADGLRLLSSTEEKAWLLERAGIDCMLVVPFDQDFSRMTPEAFVGDLLVDRLGAETLVVGYNHRFGRGNAGDYDFLERLRLSRGFRVVRVAEYGTGTERVSSTTLRGLVAAGQMARAARMLTHPYLLIGEVRAEVLRNPEPLKLLPPSGTYAVRVDGRAAGLHIDAAGTVRLPGADDGPAVVEFTGDGSPDIPTDNKPMKP